MITSHEEFEIPKTVSNSKNISFTEKNSNTPPESLTKINLHNFLNPTLSEINFQTDINITIGTLKKKISSLANIQNKPFNLLYNDKDYTNFNKLRLIDIIDAENENIPPPSPIKLKITPFESEKKNSNSNTNIVNSKYKQMLECPFHPNENAHFFCLNCHLSFCALCIEKHSTHEFLDKYDFSRSNEEIVKTIIRNVLALIQEKKNKKSLNVISEKILNPEEKSFLFKNDKEKDIVELIKKIWSDYEEYSVKSKESIENNIEKIVSDFNKNLLQFKMICLNNLTEAQKQKNNTDVITLDNDYFQTFHQTLKDLNIGRDALINYLDVRNNECDFLVNDFIKFEDEIIKDLQNILKKINNKKNLLKPETHNEKDNKTEITIDDVTEFNNINISSIDTSLISEQILFKNDFGGFDCIDNDNEIDNHIKHIPTVTNVKNNFENNNVLVDNSERELSYNNLRINVSGDIPKINKKKQIKRGNSNKKVFISNTEIKANKNYNFINQPSKYILKRKLLKEIISYNISNNKFESIKDYKRDTSKFKKFLQFSIYINAKNCLYITGGKTKENKVSKSFYCYDYENNTLTILPNMIYPRCSHSMIYINNELIQDEIFVIGGHSNNTCERYNFRSKIWKNLPSVNTKERQVSSLLVVNNYLYMLFGFVNGKKDINNYGEKLDLKKLDKWEQIKINFNKDVVKLNKFNVGLISINKNIFLLVGGEANAGGETNDIYKMEFTEKGIMISDTGMKMPFIASFIDKNFIECEKGCYAQFDMKKSNLIVYDSNNQTFQSIQFKVNVETKNNGNTDLESKKNNNK